MTCALSVLRVWGFATTVPLALALGVASWFTAHTQASVPTIPLPIPAPILVPVISVLLLSWTLHDRWAVPSVTAVRPAWVTAALRYVLTQVCCLLPAALGALGWGYREPLAVVSLGVSATSIAALVLGSRTWVFILGAGYVWLHHTAGQPTGDALHHDVRVTVASAVVALATITAFSDGWPKRFSSEHLGR